MLCLCFYLKPEEPPIQPSDLSKFISSALRASLDEVEVLVSQGLALIMMVCFVRAARIPGFPGFPGFPGLPEFPGPPESMVDVREKRTQI